MELSQRVCVQARNWDGYCVFTPVEQMVQDLMHAQEMQHSPKLFAQPLMPAAEEGGQAVERQIRKSPE